MGQPGECDFDYGEDDDCPNCGGEGFVASCFEEWACIDPEGGCDLCIRRCDWCNLPPPKPPFDPGTTSAAPHACPHCRKKFFTEQSMLQHRKAKHG